MKFSAATLLLLLANSPAAQAQSDGDEICLDGYIMDSYCIELGTLLDTGDVTLEEPDKHTIHCLVDVSVCVGSLYHVLEDPTTDGGLYGEGWEVTDNSQLVALARSVGTCDSCTGEGNQRTGFRAAVRGIVESASDKKLRVEEVALTGTDLCARVACPADVETCPDGSTVVRVLPDCEFEECPEIACPADIETCPDGSTVVRVPPDCEFEECPEIACPADIETCPDGSTVVRVPPDCEFEECPPTESPTLSPTTAEPTTEAPSAAPSASPTMAGTDEPSASPSASPSTTPSSTPSVSPSAMPSAAPSPFPTVSLAPTVGASATMMPTTNETFVNCSEYQYEMEVPGLDNVTLEYVVNYYTMNVTDNMTGMVNETMVGTMSVRVTYAGMGWIGFAVSPTGGMVGSDAVIGVPSEFGNTTGNASKYHLTFDGANGYLLLEDDQQTLMDASVMQDENYTVLEFTRFLEEEGEVPINGTGFNYFLIAHGTETNELGYHGSNGRSPFNLTLEPCGNMTMMMDDDMMMEDEMIDEPAVDVMSEGTPEVQSNGGDEEVGTTTEVTRDGPTSLESGALSTGYSVSVVLSMVAGYFFMMFA